MDLLLLTVQLPSIPQILPPHDCPAAKTLPTWSLREPCCLRRRRSSLSTSLALNDSPTVPVIPLRLACTLHGLHFTPLTWSLLSPAPPAPQDAVKAPVQALGSMLAPPSSPRSKTIAPGCLQALEITHMPCRSTPSTTTYTAATVHATWTVITLVTFHLSPRRPWGSATPHQRLHEL